ncbi:MAG: MMPL family transporter [Halanaerobium sp.]
MKKILKYNKWIIIAIAIITLFFLLQIPNVEINNDIEVFLPDDHVSKESNRRIEDIFGETGNLVVSLSLNEGTIFDKKNIEKIDNLRKDLEQINRVDEVTAITNADFIEGTSEGMEVEELVKDLPESEEDKLKIKEKLLSWDFYSDNLYSDNFKASQILITLDEDLNPDQKSEVYYQINDITENYQNNRFETYIAGAAAINVEMGDSMIQDIKLLIPFVIIILILTLYFFFHKILPVILILVTVSISSIWAVGLMAYLGINLTLVSTVIPVLLIAVGSAYGIHILSHYYDYLSEHNGDMNETEHKEIVINTMNKLGKPVFLAALTTAVGFGSLASSEIVPIRSFGIFTAVGITAAFLVALFLIPSLLLIIYQYKKNKDAGDFKQPEHFESIITDLHHFYSQRKFYIIIFSLIIIAVSFFGLNKIIIDTPLIEMFKEDSAIRVSDRFINNNFAGTTIMNVMVEGKDRGSLNNPKILNEMDNMQKYISDNFSEVGKMYSISDFIKRMNQVMHYPEEIIEEEQSQSSSDSSDSPAETDSFYQSEENSQDEEETTGSFYESDEDNQDEEETAGSFYDNGNGEDVQEDGEDVKEDTLAESKGIISGPDQKKNLSELDFIVFLNQALRRAEKRDISGNELLQLLNKEMNYKAAQYYEIPVDKEKYDAESEKNLQNLISQYLLLYSGNLDDLINDSLEPDKAQIIVQLNTPSTIKADMVREEIADYADSNFPDGYETTISGNASMALSANNLIISSQIRSILISFIVVFIIVAFSFKSLLAGLYGVIPLAFSLIINFALMGYTGIKLDVGTAMVASIAIGIGVDYTIHFLHSYNREIQNEEDIFLVSKRTLTSTGKAVIFNAASVATGFLVLVFSNFYPLVYLGLLIAVTMFTSSIGALTILPVLLNIFEPEFIKKEL